jgi:two-component system response regulator YesN
MESLTRQLQSDCPPELSAAPSLISSVLYLLAQSYYQQPQNADQLQDLVNDNSTLLQCTRYIDQHYKEPLSLTSLSKQFGLSRSAFCTLFPQFTGVSLRQYISQKRIQEAQLLIRSHPELPLSQIAMEVGYEDHSTFYRNFLRLTNISPSQYREFCMGEKDSS